MVIVWESYAYSALKRFMSLQFHENFDIQFIREPMQGQDRVFAFSENQNVKLKEKESF